MPEPCGCSFEEGRCTIHSEMMKRIFLAWTTEPGSLLLDIWAKSDGYGEPGYVPVQGYDWSGIRDSSAEAVEAMWKVAIGRI